MTPTTAVPFTITDEAAQYIRALGLQAEFDRLIEHIREAVPGLFKIHAYIQPPYDSGGPAVVIVEASMEDRHLEDDLTSREMTRWMVQNFPPEVDQYFVVFVLF